MPITRFDGRNRYDTAARIATATFATSDAVVIASGTSFADALSGNYLAGQVGGPILLTDPLSLPPETARALAQLRVRSVLVLGGTRAVGAEVITAITSMISTNTAGGHIEVSRLAGATRYDTNKLVAETPPATYVGKIGGQRTALVASAARFPDALAGGALSFGSAFPVILTDPDALSAQAGQVMADLGLQHVLILGGPQAVSPGVEASVKAAGLSVERVSGLTRTATAAAVANFAGRNLGYGSALSLSPGQSPAATFVHLNLARGDDAGGGADALALGPAAGHTKAPILLTESADNPSLDVTTAIVTSTGGIGGLSTLADVHIAGGNTAVSTAIEQMVTVDSGGGPLGVMTISPTTGTGQTMVTASSVDPCPAAPAGSSAQVAVVLVGQKPALGSLRGPDGSVPLTGGPWRFQFTLASGLPAGQYRPVALCSLSFGDGVEYPYASEAGPVLTLN